MCTPTCLSRRPSPNLRHRVPACPRGTPRSERHGTGPYLVECKGAHSVGGQLHRVQQSHLNEAVGFSATDWPVLIALHLQRDKPGTCKGVRKCPKARRGRGPGAEAGWEDTRLPSPSSQILCAAPSPQVSCGPHSQFTTSPTLAGGTRAVIEIYLFMTRSHQARFLPNLPIMFMCHFQAL